MCIIWCLSLFVCDEDDVPASIDPLQQFLAADLTMPTRKTTPAPINHRHSGTHTPIRRSAKRTSTFRGKQGHKG